MSNRLYNIPFSRSQLVQKYPRLQTGLCSKLKGWISSKLLPVILCKDFKWHIPDNSQAVLQVPDIKHKEYVEHEINSLNYL